MALVIAVSGGSGSGKSTLATALAAALSGNTAHAAPVLLSEDDYYLCSSTIHGFDPQKYDFDAAIAKDFALLANHVATLRAGFPVEQPVYDFVSHTRLATKARVDPASTIIIEGIHVLSQADVMTHCDVKVLIEAPDDLRLARRLLRDVKERGRTPESVIAQYFTTVRPNHLTTIQRQRETADLIINADVEMTVEAGLDAVLEHLRTRRLLPCGEG